MRWSCARKERWCYACKDPNGSSDPNGNEDLADHENWPVCRSGDPTMTDEELFKVQSGPRGVLFFLLQHGGSVHGFHPSVQGSKLDVDCTLFFLA